MWDTTHSASTSHTQHSLSSEYGDSDIIPPSHPARTLVLCFDGTGDQFSAENSNVVTFFSLLKKDSPKEQMVYYQPGIGTYISTTNVTGLKSKVDKVLDEMLAWNLSNHVMGGYEFLMQNYQEGDKICLFGFSRGAYTARALAGMLHKVGLLPTCNHQQVPFAYKMYTRDDPQGWAQSTAFKKAFSIDVDIDFIGVWDTVSSVGVIPHTLPFTKSNTAIRVFRHALSLDERRARFKPALYLRSTAADAKLGTQPGDMPKSDTTWATRSRMGPTGNNQRLFERQFSDDDPDSKGKTDAVEVWFAGCHCDIGGGNVTDDTPHSLARIPLRWMIREVFKTNTGIRFHAELLRRIGLNPVSLHPKVAERPPPLKATEEHMKSIAKPLTEGTEEEHEVRDALQPLYDELVRAPFWWALEVIPMQQRVQGPAPDHKEMRTVTMNLGRGRLIPKHHAPLSIHRSVKVRMEAQGLNYRPKATYEHPEITWVD
ncbi:hypothetical protein K466DRAFT_491820 [Polyporus arcularius HHB13444]|uniref:T6SS Phospholipase effector Tle1-like catalytic domain-containing protein n=1 Tax=Polyporus arcularius HHB13444 TaxID=1314778 RepID=A0A5C3PCJ5_9APHY|nr:hypothetical protein K466DRAFT_491820 [Polyporus arcularius HHB13444]